MMAIDLIVLINNPITPLILLIPIIQIPCGYIVGMAVGATIFRIRGGGRAVAINVASDQAMGLLSGAVGALVGIAPLVAYGAVMLITGLQIASLLSQAIIVAVLAAVIWKYVPKLLKD